MSAPRLKTDPKLTYVVELTPPGRGAVAVVLVAGCDAISRVAEFFTAASGRLLTTVPINRIALGRWGGASGEELIVCRRDEQRIEIHCHGGAAAVQSIVDSLASRGCRRMSWQNWLRASTNDPIQADAQIALADAPTERAAAVLLDQYHGALTRELNAISAAVRADDWLRAGTIIEGILTFRGVGLHLVAPWRVTLAGAPNVGKSSLVNAIAGYQRAIVSPIPGTTRDVVTMTTAIEGWPVQFADTAGLRMTDDELEAAGVALAGDAIAEADLVLAVSEASGEHRSDDAMREQLQSAKRVMHVVNKIDLVTQKIHSSLSDGGGAFDKLSRGDAPARSDSRYVSALTGEGIPELITSFAATLVPQPPPAGAAVAFTAQQLARLDALHQAVVSHDPATSHAVLAALLAGE
jgi:tRNA modification GTPase